jgi:hypothetical protein
LAKGETNMSSDEQEISNLVATWIAATKAGDIEKVLSLMAEDIVPGPRRRMKRGESYADNLAVVDFAFARTTTGCAQFERAAVQRGYNEWVQELIENGKFRGGAQLQPTAMAKTVRLQQRKLVVYDGPFAETKEHLGGYHLIECGNLEEALAIGARVPTLDAGGAIEVRAIEHSTEMEPPRQQ